MKQNFLIHTSTDIKYRLVNRNSHRYYNLKGEISLLMPCENNFYTYEIYDGNKLFDDVERYNTLIEAMYRIFELLKFETK